MDVFKITHGLPLFVMLSFQKNILITQVRAKMTEVGKTSQFFTTDLNKKILLFSSIFSGIFVDFFLKLKTFLKKRYTLCPLFVDEVQ